MDWGTYLIIFAICVGSIILFRVLPLFLLREKQLSETVQTALGYIPVAAFAALVANDLCTPGMFDVGFWPAALPLIAAIPVLIVSIKTKSLIWSIITGVVVYALLMLV